ncbi:MAG: alpha/beta hydrolase [bacterium]|nr:alpha/beta hydrolase [bacterium]
MAERLIRAVHRAGAGSLRATLFYPADPAGLAAARLTGTVPPAAGDPLPIVVLAPGINVAPGSYRRLATRLAGAGLVVAVYSLIGDLGPVGDGITPGIDLGALAPGIAGTRPSAPVLGEVIDLVAADPLLGGATDPARLAFGGHSAGGTVALQNAEPAWFPGVRAAFAYAGHTMAASGLGHGDAAVMPIPAATPLLLLSGARDGVIAASRDRYRSGDGDGGHESRHEPVRRTFEDAIGAPCGDCWWIELADGVHFTPCDPVDETSGRSFLDPADPPRRAETGRLLGDLLLAFLLEHLAGGPARLGDLVDRPGVSAWARR